MVVAAAITLGLAYFVLKHRQAPGRVTFALLMIAVAVCSGGYALEISATLFKAKVFWAKVQYFGIATIPLLWLRFVILYVGESSWMTPARFLLLAIGPLLTVVLFAALAPWAGNALYLTGATPFPLLDLTPFSFTVTGLVVAWGMGRFQFMGTVPVAHRAIIEGMQAGVIALAFRRTAGTRAQTAA